MGVISSIYFEVRSLADLRDRANFGAALDRPATFGTAETFLTDVTFFFVEALEAVGFLATFFFGLFFEEAFLAAFLADFLSRI